MRIKAAIIGCGKIADSHASQILRIRGCEIAGVCDREELMARQLFERFPIRRYFGDVKQMLREAQPDVVHITTPPQSHFELGRLCLEQGCHIYVEKPFTLDAAEAAELISLAERKGLKLTVGHDDQFSHAARRLRTLVHSGYLGGDPVHMASCYCYDLSDPAYAKAFLANKGHWVRRLPGKLLHNIISHGLARISEFLPGDNCEVIAHGFISPRLKAMGEDEIQDELRVLIHGQNDCTAYFTFSSQMRPSLHQFWLAGPKNALLLDEDHQTLLRYTGRRRKSYAEKFIPPLSFASQHFSNLGFNLRKFMANDFQMKAGMKCLIETFYRALDGSAPLPIPYREILLTSRIMDAIFEQTAPASRAWSGSTAPEHEHTCSAH